MNTGRCWVQGGQRNKPCFYLEREQGWFMSMFWPWWKVKESSCTAGLYRNSPWCGRFKSIGTTPLRFFSFFFSLPVSPFLFSFSLQRQTISIHEHTLGCFILERKPSTEVPEYAPPSFNNWPSNRRAIFCLTIKAPFKRVPYLTGSTPHGHSCKKRLWEQI